MKIIDVRHYNNKKALESQMRDITMLKDPLIKVYKNTCISVERLNTDCLVPPQNYVLNYELENKLELKYELDSLQMQFEYFRSMNSLRKKEADII